MNGAAKEESHGRPTNMLAVQLLWLGLRAIFLPLLRPIPGSVPTPDPDPDADPDADKDNPDTDLDDADPESSK